LYTFAVSPALNTLSYGGVVGSKRYRPLYVFIFVLIAMSNLMGMIPFSLTSTSFAVMTFFMGMTVFIGINILALASYQWKYVNLFLPSGAPLVMAPYLIVLEVISYFIRVMSLSIRLFANLLSGHALMKIIGTAVWGTPLIAAGLIASMRPIATTSNGIAENFWAFISQLQGYWDVALHDFDLVLKSGDAWLNAFQVGYQVGFYSAMNLFSAYLATFLVVFSVVGVMLYILAYYLHAELAKNLADVCSSETKNSVLFKPVWVFYGFRAVVLSIMMLIKPVSFSIVRSPGIAGMLLFVCASLKHAIRTVIYAIYSFVARGTVIATKVTFGEIATWNTYVAPVLSQAFWWLAAAFVLTTHYFKLVQYLGFANFTGMEFSWGDALTSKAITFGPFGVGLTLSLILAFAVLADLLGACAIKLNLTNNAKLSSFLSSSTCVWLESIVIVLVGLFVGYANVSAYYSLFDMALASTCLTDSMIFALIVRLAHWAPVYAIATIFFAVIFVLVAERVSASMNSDETRSWMKILWNYAPTLVAGLVLFEMLYWGLMYDVLCAGVFEKYAMKVGIIGPPSIYYSDIFGSWAGYQSWMKSYALDYITYTDRLWEKLVLNGYNPVAAILGSIASGIYVFVAFVVSAVMTTLVYVLSEMVIVVCAGVNCFLLLFALIAFPLITPIAWVFLLAITGLEMAIALLQAYVFITLSSMYLNDVIKLH
jgi:ATP synthase subunit 6